MSGLAFLLFTFYMVTDPATTPSATRDQVWFGAAVGVAYGALMVAHVVFGLFFALSLVCVARGAWVHARVAVAAAAAGRARAPVPVPVPSAAGVVPLRRERALVEERER
jgi:enediyne biosynthesis protein E5